MTMSKVAVTLDADLLKRLDRWVGHAGLPSRSRGVQEALREKLARVDRGRLARECAKLDPKREQAMADERLAGEVQWPEY